MTLTCSTIDIVHSEGGSIQSMIFSIQAPEHLNLEGRQLYDAEIMEMNEPKTDVTEGLLILCRATSFMSGSVSDIQGDSVSISIPYFR
jgi:hypothetical protein